ncbi:MAG: ABC transporter ATP-binding protein [Chthoniobacterales bacterium]
MSHVIETRALTRRFRSQEAVNDLNLAMPAGSAFAFLGRNGAGKTTTIRMLAGLLLPSHGGSALLGTDSTRLRPEDWRQIGYVSEDQRLYQWMTGGELVAFTAALYPKWDHEFAKKLGGLLDLPLSRKVRTYSKGQRAKLSLLLSISYHPRLLILDEPFGGLDPLSREEFISSLLEVMQQEEWSVFFSTHEIDDVERLADYVGIIEEGVLQVSEPLETLQARFRQVDTNASTTPPGRAICVETSGERLRYVDPDFPANANGGDASPMSLKQIFLALAKNFQLARRRSA